MTGLSRLVFYSDSIVSVKLSSWEESIDKRELIFEIPFDIDPLFGLKICLTIDSSLQRFLQSCKDATSFKDVNFEYLNFSTTAIEVKEAKIQATVVNQKELQKQQEIVSITKSAPAAEISKIQDRNKGLKQSNLETSINSKQKISNLKGKHTTDRDEMISKYESELTKLEENHTLELSQQQKQYKKRYHRYRKNSCNRRKRMINILKG